MNENKIESPTETPEDPNQVANQIKQKFSAMGGNDSENPQLDSILDLYNKGKMSVEEANKKLKEIEENKLSGDYH